MSQSVLSTLLHGYSSLRTIPLFHLSTRYATSKMPIVPVCARWFGKCRGFGGKKDAWRVDFASPARATSVSRENNLQSSREQLAILARNGSNSREKWKCFSRETKVFLARNGSVSREKWMILSEGSCFSVGSHAFAAFCEDICRPFGIFLPWYAFCSVLAGGNRKITKYTKGTKRCSSA